VTDRTATAKVLSGRIALPIKAGTMLARVLPEEVSGDLNVQLNLPTLPGMTLPADSRGGGSKAKNDDW
jgi:hypothetical protein